MKHGVKFLCAAAEQWDRSHQLETGGERECGESDAGYAVFGLQTAQVTWAIALGSFNLSPAKLLLPVA